MDDRIPEMLLLALDIGNSNIVAGIFHHDHLLWQWRLESNTNLGDKEYGALFSTILSKHGISPTSITYAIICSVVPVLENVITGMCQDLFAITPITVGPGLDTGMSIDYHSTATLGPDRIVNSVAAFERYGDGNPIIVVDAGTAITLDVVTGAGTFIGGAILPGLRISLSALVSGTARLPAVALELPERAIGRNTVECIQSGVCLGAICMVDGLLERMEEELGGCVTMVATGGFSSIITRGSRKITIHDPDLTLRGLQIIHSRVIRK